MAQRQRKQRLPKHNRKGARSDTSYTIQAANEEQAESLYNKAKVNLLSVNQWKSIAGETGADFALADPYGDLINGQAKTGCYIRIHLPTSKKKKYDWVVIESIESIEDGPDRLTQMRVRPAGAPGSSQTDTHFFGDEATSNFVVEKKGRKLTASVHGRNEVPNTTPINPLSKLRNITIAFFAMLGFNKPQWKALTKGLLTK